MLSEVSENVDWGKFWRRLPEYLIILLSFLVVVLWLTGHR